MYPNLLSLFLLSLPLQPHFLFFFFNDTATTEIYTLSLHDALPISSVDHRRTRHRCPGTAGRSAGSLDRKSTRLNSSHQIISYAVFCLKKKNQRWRDLHRVRRRSRKKRNLHHTSLLVDHSIHYDCKI